ncbi:MAG: SDR family NAD(P)-dependent oxidoreductase [Magnetococcales bacterium]|nr:SDR family NAD(P)-dependent oxidoreductase [Magnetococcales bacterium]
MSDSSARIAVIGMAGRFPGAADLRQFWENLAGEVESITFFTPEALIAAGVDPAVAQHPDYVPANGVLEGVEWLDAAFFGLTPREAEATDPQHRLMLECAWEALENAGYVPNRLTIPVGVFAGCGPSSYLLHNLLPNVGFLASVDDFQLLVGNNKDFAPTRISYKLNLKGPSLNISTACSTSLVAVQTACQALLDYQCDLALAGGAGIHLPQEQGYLYHKNGIGSPDGHCRPFDAAAQGTVNGNGVGMVVLKRLEEALDDGDFIYGVIAGAAINNDGADKIGFTAPSVSGQAEVIATALALAGFEPETLSCVETHGTATELGDPIEIEALSRAFGPGLTSGQCAIGSVKSNIGHLDEAAGVAGLIKTLLALTHKTLPASLHYHAPNPKIPFAKTPFQVNARTRPWPAGSTPRRAAVSSFGIGGTNASVMVEEAPLREGSAPSRDTQVLMLSARTPQALEQAVARLAQWLEENPGANLADVAYTLQVGRAQFRQRRAVPCRSRAEALVALRAGQGLVGQWEGSESRPVVWLFPGQGTQRIRMGATLYASESLFRALVDQCAQGLVPHLGFDLRSVLFPAAGQEEQARARLIRTDLAQPALFVIEYALAKLWMAWGITPQAMLGHSLGEYVAACLAGVFTLEEALKITALRGRLMQSMPAGAMVAVVLPEEPFRALLTRHDLALAAHNGPQHWVAAGTFAAIAALEAELTEREIPWQRLATSHAFHSALMAPILAPFEAALRHCRLQPPSLPFLSNLTGHWITPQQATDPGYWSAHLRQAVRFADGVAELSRTLPKALYWELGPGRVLTSLVRKNLGNAVELLTGEEGDECATLGRLFVAGVGIDWKGFYAGERRMRCPLPGYPFERQRYWVESRVAPPAPQVASGGVDGWLYQPVWKALPLRPAPVTAARWLVFLDDWGLGAALVSALRAQGESVVTVRVGVGFERLGAEAFALVPERGADYQRLIQAAGPVQRVAHLWLVSGHGDSCALAHGFESLLHLARALEPIQDEVRIGVVTTRLDRYPEKALVQGPVKGIGLEYPGRSCCAVELAWSGDVPVAGWMVDGILSEIRAGGASGGLVALHEDRRSILAHEPIMSPSWPVATGWRAGGVYLITGGTGGMGLAMAEHLVRRHRAKVILISRSGASAALTGRIAAWGGEVLVLAADVADREAMTRALDQARERFGAIHGVIHAAGIADGGLIWSRTPAQDQAVLAPKFQGLRVLEQVLDFAALDFLLLCSALSGVTGAFGQVAYGAANAFLDHYAASMRARHGLRVTALAWDGWRETGMAKESAASMGRHRLDHPLFASMAHDGARIVYAAILHANDWLLDEHRIAGMRVLPGTAYLDRALAAMQLKTGGSAFEMADFFFVAPWVLEADETRTLEVVLEEQAEGVHCTIRSASAPGVWIEHAQGRMRVVEAERKRGEIGQLQATLEASRVGLERFAPRLGALGVHWHCLRQVGLRDGEGDGEGVALLELAPAYEEELIAHPLHPALLDVATGLLVLAGHGAEEGMLPFGYARLTWFQPLPRRVISQVRVVARSGDQVTFDVNLYDETGLLLVEVRGYSLRAVRTPRSAENFRVRIVTPGDLESLTLVPVERPAPGAGQVELAVACVGLNFKEVLFALGLLPEAPDPAVVAFGLECSGVVSRVGAGVEGLAVGDRVMAFASEALGRHVVVDAQAVVAVPAGLSLEQAATVPAAFVTAYYALVELARLQPGEKILIHSATGGVGLAAVHIARWIGAEIFATAGNPEKRAYLSGLGIQTVLDSRSLDFVAAVRNATQGRGVDVVLNALAGEYLSKSLGLLAPFGRFLELGVRDFYANRGLDLAPFVHNLSFFAVGVGVGMPGFARLFAKVAEHLAHQDFAPLPVQLFPLARMADGFRLMSQARHIGKVVIAVGGSDASAPQSIGLTTAQGLEILDRVVNLADPPARIVVSLQELGQRIATAAHVDAVIPVTPGATHARPDLGIAFVPVQGATQQAVAEIWELLFGISGLGARDDFFALGGDSLLAAQVNSRLRKRFGVELSMGALFEHPTIATLADHIDRLRPLPHPEVDEEEEFGEL